MACGSGDAQTLCVTSDDNVWSWGDGDYGKLGHNISESCKVRERFKLATNVINVSRQCFSALVTLQNRIAVGQRNRSNRLWFSVLRRVVVERDVVHLVNTFRV